MKAIRFLAVTLSFLFALNSAWAKENLSADLRKAQKALAAGDYEKAFAEYVKVAEDQHNSLAQFTVGLFYEKGWGRPAQPAKAYHWFEKAASGGNPGAQHSLGDYLVAGVHCKADPAKAARLYKKAADSGHHISLCSLAELYMTGTGVDKDPNQAIALCREVADKGSVPAQVRLARFFLDGDKSIRDHAKAYRCFEMAAQRNSPQAMYYLGVIHRDGRGKPKAPNIARYWFENAASRKYGPAYLPTGELYFKTPADSNSDQPSAHDLAKAYLWLSAAARHAKELKDKKPVDDLLKKVHRVMPPAWKPDLDAKVNAHFSTKP